MKKRILAVLLLLAALTICACSAEQTDDAEQELTEAEAAQSQEKLEELAAVFSKTVHDFEGYAIDNLDESEDNNFVVWQKGVTEIELSDSVNVIEEADEESLTYQFKNADETLKALQKGDVFYGMSADGETAVAGKVKSIKVSEDTVQIEGAEMELGDLYKYVDIDMGVGVETVTVGELPEGVTAEYVTEATADGVRAEEAAPRLTTLAAGEPEEARAATLGFGGSVHLNPALKFTVSVSGHAGDASLGNDLTNPGDTGVNVKGNLALTGKYTYTIKGIDAAFHFMDDEALFYAGAQVHANSNLGIDLTGSGTIAITQLIAPELNIPVPGFPLLKIGGKLSLTASATGSIKGGIKYTQDHTNGYQIGCTVEDGFFCGKIEEFRDPNVTLNVEELSGTVLIGPVFETNLGVWGTGKAYGEAFGGLEFKGSYDPFETTFTPEEAVHDCDVCIDGSIDFMGRIRVGAKTELPGLKQKGKYFTFPEIRHDFKDFYVSFGREGVNEPEFGWDKCPYKRFRTDITVLNEGEKVKNAKVKAESADGRSFEETTDENGYAKLFLPVGDNVVTASSRGAKGTANVPIKDSPVSVTINLTDERQIFITYRYWLDGKTWMGKETFPYITDKLLMLYPEAELYSAEEWGDYTGGWGENNHITTPLEEPYGVSPGDIIINVFVGYSSIAVVNEYSNVYSVPYNAPYQADIYVGMVVLPPEEEVEMGISSDEPYVIWFGDHMVSLTSDWASVDDADGRFAYSVITAAQTHVKERQWLGYELDEDFRITKMGQWSEWSEWESAFWSGSITERNFYNSANSYFMTVVEQGFSTICKTVDMLWTPIFEEDTSGDIVVSETP